MSANRPEAQTHAGIDAFIQAVAEHASVTTQQNSGDRAFVLKISEDFAFIRLADVRTPLKFLKQLSGDPPIKFGTQGFRKDIVDDQNPARHYTAFVFVGYWLPMVLGWLALYAWEILGYFRYGFRWSANDLRCGVMGLRHGRAVRKEGARVLSGLIQRDLKQKT